MRAPARAALGTCVLALVLPPAAAASSASLTFEPPVPGVEDEGAYSLDVLGAGGEANQFVVFGDEIGYTVRDAAATLVAGVGCDAVDAHEVHCATTETTPNRSVVVFAGEGADAVEMGSVPGLGFLPGPSTVEVHGGDGDDVVRGDIAHELLVGGDGADQIFAGDGFDRIDGGAGDDTLDGGPGQDRVSYEERERPVAVDLAAGTGGEDGEHDALAAIEDVVGGSAADRIAGDRGPNELTGGEQGTARDFVSGRGGADRLTGYRVRGGRGPDRLDGRRMACDAGRDLVYRGVFKTRGPYPAECELALATFVAVTARPLAVGKKRAVFGVRCAAQSCRGRLELIDSAGRLGSAHFSMENGDDPLAVRRIRVRLERQSDDRVWGLRVRGRSAFHHDHFRTRVS